MHPVEEPYGSSPASGLKTICILIFLVLMNQSEAKADLYPSGTRLNTSNSEYEIMTSAYNPFRPNGLKLLLAFTLLVPVFFFGIVLVTGFPYNNMVFPAAITIVISYVAACVLDEVIQSRTIKILIASVAALVSIILGYILVRSMTMVCDPVHDPGHIICDPVHLPETTTAPTIITTVQPTATTPMIFDPVHEPNSCGQACRDALGNAAGTTEIVAQKLDECLQNCYR